MYGRPSRFAPSGAGRRQSQPQQQQPWPQPQPQAQFPAAPFFNPNVQLEALNHILQSSGGFIPGHQNVNFPMQNSNLPTQNHGFQFSQASNPGFHFPQSAHAGFHSPQPPNTGSQAHGKTTMPAEGVTRINNAVAKAHSDLLVAKESISAWKVSQSALSILQVDSWDSLGVRMQEIDALHRLIAMEGKVTRENTS